MLEAKPALLGTFCTFGSIDAVELAAHAGFDFVLMDGQHGAFDLAGLREAVRAVQATDSFPIARLPAYSLSHVEALLDAGYSSLLAPMVNTPEQARELVAACHYPPMGVRSQSGCRAGLRDGASYRERFNEEFSLLVMIEHIQAVRRIEEILAVPGVSGCFVGPTDLASSLEGAGDREALAEAIARVRAATREAGKIAGIAASTVEAARRHREAGFQVIAVGTDRRLLSGALAQVAAGWQEGA